MSYMQDPDGRHRGVGAIAAVDGASSRRARKQMMKNRVLAVIDARRARLAHGPGRALPVPLRGLGRITQEGGEGAGSPATGGGGGGGGGGVTIPTFTRPTLTAAITEARLQTVATPYPTVGPVVDPGPTTTTPPPLTTTATPTAPTGGGKTGYVPPAYTGGGGTFTMPSQPLPTFPAPSSVEELGPPSGGDGISMKTIALVAGGIGLLYLLTRKSDE